MFCISKKQLSFKLPLKFLRFYLWIIFFFSSDMLLAHYNYFISPSYLVLFQSNYRCVVVYIFFPKLRWIDFIACPCIYSNHKKISYICRKITKLAWYVFPITMYILAHNKIALTLNTADWQQREIIRRKRGRQAERGRVREKAKTERQSFREFWIFHPGTVFFFKYCPKTKKHAILGSCKTEE